MPRDLSSRSGTQGITLIELLVAISVSTVVMAVGLSVYMTISASLRRQDRSRLDTAVVTLDMLRHDLASCIQASLSNMPALELETTPEEGERPASSTLTFCSGILNEGDADFSRLEVSRLRYTLCAETDSASDQTLQREVVTVWGPEALAPPRSNALLRAVSRFEVNVLDGDTWTNQWVSRPARALPRAARIRLDWASARTSETASIIVFIPAGNTVSPGKPSPP
jgi:type II secretion system protein J